MKIKINIFIGFIFILMLAGCTNKEETAKELVDYNNNIHLQAEKMKNEFRYVLNELENIEQEGDEEAAIFIEEEILPKVKETIDYLESVEEPKQREINKLHQLNMDAEKTAYQGMQDIVEVYKGNEDENQILENRLILRQKYEEFLEERTSLMEKYNVVFEEDSDTGYGMRIKLKEDE